MKKQAKEDKDFFGLFAALTNAERDKDGEKFGDLCDQIFREEYKDGKEGLAWLKEELPKIEDGELRDEIRMAAEEIAEKTRYFYLALGYALAQDLEILDPEAQEEVTYLRERIRKARIFPTVAKKVRGGKETILVQV